MLATLKDLDLQLFHYLNQSFTSPWLDHAMMFVSSKYTWLAMGVAVVAVALLRARRRLIGACVLLGLTLGATDFVTYQVLKPLFARERPCHALHDGDIHLVPIYCGGDYGMPSNHAANGMAVTVVLALNYPGIFALAALLMTLLTGLSRVYLGVHYPGDVLGGFTVGALVGLACHFGSRIVVRGVARFRAAKAAEPLSEVSRNIEQ